MLRVHSMLRDVIGAHGEKCSLSDVQRHERVRDLTQNLGREMQTSRRRSHGTGLTRKNRLIPREVRFIAWPIEIRR